MATTENEIRRLLGELRPAVRESFLEAMDNVAGNINRPALLSALRRQDIEAAVRALNLNPAALDVLRETIRDAVKQGGVIEVVNTPATIHAFFAVGNPRAEAIAAQRAGTLIQDITQGSLQAVRERVTEGIATGENPLTTARTIAGTYDRRTGQRTGGVVGLTARDNLAASRARDELRNLSPSYLQRKARDKRYDPTIARAIRTRKPLSREYINRVILRYQDSLLHKRGLLIAQTETIAALNGGRYEYLQQLVDDGRVLPEEITLTWKTLVDDRVRDTHVAMHDKKTKFGTPFVFPRGGQARYPGDNTLGAPSREVVNCRCTMQIHISWIKARKRERQAQAA